MASEALLKQAPQPPTTIAEPDDLGSVQDALAYRFAPQAPLERFTVPQDGDQSALLQPGDALAYPSAMLASTGEHPHVELAPAHLPPGVAALWPKRHQDALGPQDQRQSRELGPQRLWRRLVPLRHGGAVCLESLHGLVAGRLDPTPHRPGTDHATAVPAQQPRRGRKRPKDRPGTAQRLQLPTGPLMRLYPQSLIEGSDLWERAPVGTPSDTAAPADRSEQARELALGKPFTAQRGPTGWAGRPRERSLGAFGQHLFDNVESQHTCERPHGPDELRQCLSLFDRLEQLLHAGIIMPYAVAKA